MLSPSHSWPEFVVDATPIQAVVRVSTHETLATTHVTRSTAVRVPADDVSTGRGRTVETFERVEVS